MCCALLETLNTQFQTKICKVLSLPKLAEQQSCIDKIMATEQRSFPTIFINDTFIQIEINLEKVRLVFLVYPWNAICFNLFQCCPSTVCPFLASLLPLSSSTVLAIVNSMTGLSELKFPNCVTY